jgi:IS30 family transposase
MNNSPTNKVSYTHLTPKKRIELSVLLRTTLKQKDIARMLNKDPSTISRELRRNKTDKTKTGYSYKLAGQLTKQRRIEANKRFRKIKSNKKLKRYIVSKPINKYWSPEQIAGRWNKDHSIKQGITISHESIYQYIYNDNPRLRKYLLQMLKLSFNRQRI